MRFSNIFQRASQPERPAKRQAAPTRRRLEEERERERESQLEDLPEDLDARVRLVGEWQLGEA